MDAERLTPPDGDLPAGRIVGREAFVQMVRDALVCAAREGWKEMILSDATFEDWPLRERAVVESLQQWAGSGRQLTLLAHSFTSVARDQPRFVAWRKMWDHVITARTCRTLDVQDFPSALWSPAWSLQRIDAAHGVVLCGRDAQQRQHLRERLNEVLHVSAPGFAATTLGL